MIVSNSSCLIILDKLGKLELLERLYTKVIIPVAVKNEVFKSRIKPYWIEVVEDKSAYCTQNIKENLGER